MYGNVLSLLVNKIAQVFTSGEFTFVATMKSRADGEIGIMDICDKHGIPLELRYDHAKKKPTPVTIMQRITGNFYRVGRSIDSHTQQQNKCERKIRDL